MEVRRQPSFERRLSDRRRGEGVLIYVAGGYMFV